MSLIETRRILLFAPVLLLLCNSADAQKKDGKIRAVSFEMVIQVSFSENGESLLAVGDSTQIFDVKSAQCLRENQNQRSVITRSGIFLSPSNRRFMTCSDDGKIQIWDLDKKQKSHEFETKGFYPSGFKQAPNGPHVAWEMDNENKVKGKIVIFDTKKLETVREFEFPNHNVAYTFSPDGKYFAIAKSLRRERGKYDSEIIVYSRSDWKQISKVPFDSGFASDLFFSAKDKLIVGGGECIPSGPRSCTPTGHIWHVDIFGMEKAAKKWDLPESGYFPSLKLLPNERQFVTVTTKLGFREVNPYVQLRNVADGKLVWETMLKIAGESSSIDVNSKNGLIACGVYDKIYLLSIETGKLAKTIDRNRARKNNKSKK